MSKVVGGIGGLVKLRVGGKEGLVIDGLEQISIKAK